MVLFCFFCWKKTSKNHLRSASGKGSGRPRQRKVRPAATAFDIQPRTKSLDVVATRVITGTSHWTMLDYCGVAFGAQGWTPTDFNRLP